MAVGVYQIKTLFWAGSSLPMSREGPRKVAMRHFFPSPSGLAANGQLLPVELFVEKEDQKVDVYFSSIK